MAPSPAPPTPKEAPPRKRPARTNGGVKIAGTVIPFDDDDVDLSKGTSPTPLFPPYNPSLPASLSATEKAQVASFLALRSRIHEGPFYTILDTNARIGKAKASSAATFDPFEGMPTYSQKYIKKRRRLPKLSARPYVVKKDAGSGDEEEAGDKDPDEEGINENVDDEFDEEDDEDAGGDYNAEQYFDDGGDDAG
ncbi:MAG: hypothetical protein Q9198_003802, partial [Flavoplaca austrocitrina]